MPWVGVAYLTLQEDYGPTAPAGQSVYRVLGNCAICNSKFNHTVAPGSREHDLQVAFDTVHAHLAGHLVPTVG